jgi:uncharacterized protein involved in exopolysaccharide biosynthesis/Mrp family chromosome partitioning ATPase
MHDKKTASQSGGLNLGDIYYVLFRRKWLIIGFSAAGLIAALLVRTIMPAPYQSEAKLFIRYVMDSKSLNPMGGDSKVVQSLTDQGDTIINGELEILKSLDLANEVAQAIGPEKILGQGAGTNAAGIAIRNGLQVDPPQRGSVIKLVFKHSDKNLVQPVLSKVIEIYFKKHVEIHGAVGIFEEVLTREKSLLGARLASTEDRLRKAKASAGVISVEDAKKSYTEQISKIRQELFNAEAELAEHQAAVQELNKRFPTKTDKSDESSSSEQSAVPPEQLGQYNAICTRLDTLRKKEQELLSQYTPQNALVKETRQQITEAEKSKQKAEEENPKLVSLNLVVSKPGERPPVDLFTESVQITALVAKIKTLSEQLDKIRNEAKTMDVTEADITELQRAKELEDSRYRYYSESLERAHVNDALSSGKVSNISKIQEPSPPFKDAEKLHKLLLTILLGGIAAGLGLAFVVELYLDRSVRRPAEIETKLNLPLFVSMPDTKRNGYARAYKKRRNKPVKVIETEEANSAGPGNGSPNATNGTGEVAPWDVEHPLRPFYEGLRDRLVTYFEVRKLTHKPKLVALAGCAKGAGVTNTAAGLAACLSEAGDGNVLLVDMNHEHGAAHHFYKGELGCALDDLLENGKRDEALVHDNLYVVSEGSNSNKLPRIMPKRFTSLVPKLKASDYDYIIFDMPPINQISITPRLAGFMDIVLLVVESEKTDRDLVKRAAALLAESKANVGVVLNRTRSHVPRKLLQEF